MIKKYGSKSILFIVLTVCIVIPLLNLISYSDIGAAKELIFTKSFGSLVVNSLSTAIVSSLISLVVALLAAWFLNRSNIKHKNIFVVLLTVPMLIPSISHAIGLIILFGSNGIITKLLGFNFQLFGFSGIVMGSVLYSFPVAFLLLNDVFKYEDFSTYEAAEVLGLSKLQQMQKITYPNIRKSLVTAFFVVFTMVFTDYGVPVMIGGKLQTLSTYMYREIIGLLNFSNGAIIGLLLLIPAVVAFIVDLKLDNTENATVTKAYEIHENKTRDIIGKIFIYGTSFLVILPILAFVVLSSVKQFPNDLTLSMVHIKEAGNLGIWTYLRNSITIALTTAFLGTIISYLTAVVTSRSERSFSTMTLHLLSMFSLAVPGVVLGLAYVLYFNGTMIYNTIFILVLVNIVHFFSSPYLMAHNSLANFSSTFEDIADSLGISKTRMVLDVYIPNTKDTIMEIFTYFFTNAMITISAVSFLSNIMSMPLALLIPQLDAQSLIEPTALISLIILLVNIVFKFLMKFSFDKKKEVEYE